jgi:hypothetical protein
MFEAQAGDVNGKSAVNLTRRLDPEEMKKVPKNE